MYLSVVPRGGQDSAGDIPADAPHRGAVVVELASLPDLKPAYTEITKIIALGLVYFCGHSSQFFFLLSTTFKKKKKTRSILYSRQLFTF